MTVKQETCAERVQVHWDSRKEALETLWKLYQDDPEASCEDYGRLDEFGLCFDYVAPDTFTDQPEAFWRYQLSTGGPGDELRFFASTPESRCYRIEYWFLDWFDGASIDISGEEIARDLWDWFKDSGTTEHAQSEALR